MTQRSHGGAAPLARTAMAYVLAGGRGSRLMEMTDRRAKPAVYFGGKSRIIDFALSNALNSGIRRIGVATQYKAHSLIRHLQRGWTFFRPERNESFDILPASQRVSETTFRRFRVESAACVSQSASRARQQPGPGHHLPRFRWRRLAINAERRDRTLRSSPGGPMPTKTPEKKATPKASATSGKPNALQKPLQPSEALAAVAAARRPCPGARW